MTKALRSETKASIGYPCEPSRSIYTVVGRVKNQLIWLITLGEETFGVTLPQVKIANNRYCRTSMGSVGRLKLNSKRAESSTGCLLYFGYKLTGLFFVLFLIVVAFCCVSIS